jgi:PAS domain S-box-containing protein
MLNLFQYRNKEKVIDIFVSALNSMLNEIRCTYSENMEHSEGKDSIEICTSHYSFGTLIIENQNQQLQGELHNILQNAVQMLALALEKIEYQKMLSDESYLLQTKVEEQTQKANEFSERLNFALNAVDDGIWDWFPTKNKLFWSKKYYEMLGYLENEIEPNFKNWENIIYPDDKETAIEKIKNCISGKTNDYNQECRFIKKNSEIIWILVRGRVLERNSNSEIIRMAGTHTNITEWKKVEQELKLAKEKAEENENLKTAFLQNISHEIRTPMNAIQGFSKLLNKQGISEEKRNGFISIIQNSSTQLLLVVSNVLTISSLETRQEKTDLTKVCINQMLVDLLTIYKSQTNNQNVLIFAKNSLSDPESEIYTDSTKLNQILTNLLNNALKFTRQGFVEFGYILVETHDPLEIHDRASLQEIQFYVKDTGIGIDPKYHQIIFERFNQANSVINQNYGGTGLGLSISKGFVELLGGKIWLESELEKGTCFYFTIPYKPVKKPKTKLDNMKNLPSSATILVAEDEEYNFQFIKEILSNTNLKIIHAKDGIETVEICKNNKDIDLVLMDIKMPMLDGHSAAMIIKDIKPHLPIISQTAYALESEIAKYGEIFDDYITKPIQEDILLKILNKYIGNI